MDKRVLLLILLISTPVIPRRSSSGGGGNFNRGSSNARGNPSGGFQQGGGQPGGFNQGGGFNQPRPPMNTGGGFQQGGFGGHPPQPSRPNNIGFGNNVGGGARPPPNTGFGGRPGGNFGGGGPHQFQQSGVGSRASSGGWKTALAAGALGAVGGVVAWEAGKAIIRSANEPFNHGGRNYYWDNNNPQQRGMQSCSMPLSELQGIQAGTTTTTTTTTAAPVTTDPNAATTTLAPTPDNVLNTIQYPDGTRPKTVTWSCKQGAEICCGTDCCPAPAPINQGSRPSATGGGSSIGTVVALILIFLLLLCCCGCFIVYKCFGGLFDCLKSDDNKRNDYDQGQGEYPMQQYGQQPAYSQPHYDHQQGGYPPQNQYPNQQGYPPQPHLPNQYNPNQYAAYPQHPQY